MIGRSQYDNPGVWWRELDAPKQERVQGDLRRPGDLPHCRRGSQPLHRLFRNKCTFTNWLGNSAPSLLSNTAFSFAVPVSGSI